MKKLNGYLYSKTNARHHLVMLLILIVMMAWNYALLVVFPQNQQIFASGMTSLKDCIILFGGLSCVLLVNGIYTIPVYWYSRRFLRPCLIRALFGFLYMIPILNICIDKESMEDMEDAWSEYMAPDKYRWTLSLSSPILLDWEEEEKTSSVFGTFLFRTILNMIKGLIKFVFFFTAAFIFPVLSPLATAVTLYGVENLTQERVLPVALLGIASLAGLIFLFVVIPVKGFFGRSGAEEQKDLRHTMSDLLEEEDIL